MGKTTVRGAVHIPRFEVSSIPHLLGRLPFHGLMFHELALFLNVLPCFGIGGRFGEDQWAITHYPGEGTFSLTEGDVNYIYCSRSEGNF